MDKVGEDVKAGFVEMQKEIKLGVKDQKNERIEAKKMLGKI